MTPSLLYVSLCPDNHHHRHRNSAPHTWLQRPETLTPLVGSDIILPGFPENCVIFARPKFDIVKMRAGAVSGTKRRGRSRCGSVQKLCVRKKLLGRIAEPRSSDVRLSRGRLTISGVKEILPSNRDLSPLAPAIYVRCGSTLLPNPCNANFLMP